MLVWERMVSMLPMTFEACVSEEEDTRSMLSLRLRLQQLLWGRKYVRFCVRARADGDTGLPWAPNKLRRPRAQDLAGRPQKCCCSYGQWHSLSAAGMGRLV